MDNQILESEIIESYTLDDIYEEVANFSEMTSVIVEKIIKNNILSRANSYLTELMLLFTA